MQYTYELVVVWASGEINYYPYTTKSEAENGIYHVFAEADDSTEDFLEEYYPDELENYRKMVESIPTDSSWDRVGINRFIASQTYNSIRPIVDDIELCEWLTIDEDEYYRD